VAICSLLVEWLAENAERQIQQILATQEATQKVGMLQLALRTRQGTGTAPAAVISILREMLLAENVAHLIRQEMLHTKVVKSRCDLVTGCVPSATITTTLETKCAESVVLLAQKDAVISSCPGTGLVLSAATTSLPRTRYAEDVRRQIPTRILTSKS
jgi:cytosine/adenosine deaminase-related metal-dependent hydrolase